VNGALSFATLGPPKGKHGPGRYEEPFDYGLMPHAVFNLPEIAGVGATEEELKKSGTSFIAASVHFMNTTKGRAVK
jgi:pyruvate/2-oxoglutarate dehydrogenase complex dihydrolipoamide dehydrogenase (E3) component